MLELATERGQEGAALEQQPQIIGGHPFCGSVGRHSTSLAANFSRRERGSTKNGSGSGLVFSGAVLTMLLFVGFKDLGGPENRYFGAVLLAGIKPVGVGFAFDIRGLTFLQTPSPQVVAIAALTWPLSVVEASRRSTRDSARPAGRGRSGRSGSRVVHRCRSAAPVVDADPEQRRRLVSLQQQTLVCVRHSHLLVSGGHRRSPATVAHDYEGLSANTQERGVERRRTPDPLAHINDVIVVLHEEGENVFQASARAALIEGATPYFPALFAEIANTGRVLLASGETTKLHDLTLEGWRRSATSAGLRRLRRRQSRSREAAGSAPRIPVADLSAALRNNGYPIPGESASWNRDVTPVSRLAEATELNYPLLHRIATGKQETVALESALTILRHLGYDEQARTRKHAARLRIPRIATTTTSWSSSIWRHKLASRSRRAGSSDSRRANSGLYTTFFGSTLRPNARPSSARPLERDSPRQWSHSAKNTGEIPVTLTRRLRDQARKMYDAESRSASEREHNSAEGFNNATRAQSPPRW